MIIYTLSIDVFDGEEPFVTALNYTSKKEVEKKFAEVKENYRPLWENFSVVKDFEDSFTAYNCLQWNSGHVQIDIIEYDTDADSTLHSLNDFKVGDVAFDTAFAEIRDKKLFDEFGNLVKEL